MEGIEQWACPDLAHGPSFLGQSAPDLTLDAVERTGPFQRLLGNRLGVGEVNVIEFVTHMRPTSRFCRGGSEQPVKACIAIGLKCR
jgi:hypothetical protein